MMPTRTAAQQRGNAAEAHAERHLIARGLCSVMRNYRCAAGELDLVMRDGDTLVFVEVRARRDTRYGGAAASVDTRKQHRIVLAAQHYLQRQRLYDKVPCRFDVVCVTGDERVQWIRNAFTL